MLTRDSIPVHDCLETRVLPTRPCQNGDIHEFRNDNFTRGRYDLLKKVSRKPSSLKIRSNCKADDSSNLRISRIAKCHLAFQEALKRQQAVLSQSTNDYHHHHVYAQNTATNPTTTSYSSTTSTTWNQYAWDNIQVRTPKTNPPSKIITTPIEQPQPPPTQSQKKCQPQQDLPITSTYDVTQLLNPDISPRSLVQNDDMVISSLEDSLALDSPFSKIDDTFCKKFYDLLQKEEQDAANGLEPEVSCMFSLPDLF
ncbi:hypothetical protein LAZ67_1005292 [Cordylochernes scorpioides]|uniref:Uncharacterized protein n=1 Tax=Cordylochernes scorpioides TaxID=51811 RepID=A0ABY6JY10_9ARAC|nr:hypothetical protein LAZ67_1005292 [Cordylochernes scorpioides]